VWILFISSPKCSCNRQANNFPSPSAETASPSSTVQRRHGRLHSEDVTTPVLVRSHGVHLDEPRTPPISQNRKDGEPELELDVKNLGLEDREIPSDKLPKVEKTGKLGLLGFGKKHNKWGLGMFGGNKSQHSVFPVASASSTPSLKRTQSSSSDSKSLRETSPINESPARRVDVQKHEKKERERLQREAEKQRRALAVKIQREQARAVMQKRRSMEKPTDTIGIEWISGPKERLDFGDTIFRNKQTTSGPIRRDQGLNGNAVSMTANPAAGRSTTQVKSSFGGGDWRRDNERLAKVRRRDFDSDHSMSSSDVHSMGGMSSISFGTMDSDRMTSTSSLRTSFDDCPASSHPSDSPPSEGQLAHDFRTQTYVNPGSGSPPLMQMLSLSPLVTPSSSPTQHKGSLPRREQSPQIRMAPSLPQHSSHINPNSTYSSPFEFTGMQSHLPSSYGHPPSPSPGSLPKSAINPIFKVVSCICENKGGFVPDRFFVQPPLLSSADDRQSSPNTLPPFSHLEAVAEREYAPPSPMSFNPPSKDA